MDYTHMSRSALADIIDEQDQLIKSLRKQVDELKFALTESRENDRIAMSYLNDFRHALEAESLSFPDAVKKAKSLITKNCDH